VFAVVCTVNKQLFATELFVQFWDIVVPLSLVKVASDRVSEVVLGSKLGHRLASSTTTRAICQLFLGEADFTTLLVEQEDIAMQTYIQNLHKLENDNRADNRNIVNYW